MKKNKFNPGARITIFFVTFAIIFFSLGLWQIERGQAKTALLEEYEKNTLEDPKEINNDSKNILLQNNIAWEEGGHSEDKFFKADEIIKSPGIDEKSFFIQRLKSKNIPVRL